MSKDEDLKPSSLVERWTKETPTPREYFSQCFFCSHLRKHETCIAFPNGIPEKILYNEIIHNTPHPGDSGIQYEPKREEYRDIKFKPLR